MSKKSRFRVPLDKQHGKPAETLLKSARQISDLLNDWRQLSWKNSLFEVSKILGVFANT